MGTCQAAGGQGPGGLVCWWLRSQTRPECCEAHPAQPAAETPPCKGGVKGSPGPTLSSALPACGASPCRPSPQGPLLRRALCPSMQAPVLFNSPHPKPQPHLASIIPSQNRKDRHSGLWRLLQPISHPSVLDPGSILAQTPTCPSHLQSLHFAPGLGPRSPVHQRR